MKNLVELIGNTPIIRLNGPSNETGCEILGKAEFVNPGGSVKDRAAWYIIKDAIETGNFDQVAPSWKEPQEIQVLGSH